MRQVHKLQGRPASVGEYSHQGQFEIVKELHQSNGGEVHLARVKEQRAGHQFPKEVILKRRRFAELGKAKDMLNEYEVLKKLSHPNIIGCYGYFWEFESSSLFIVLEYANRGDLHSELQTRRQLGNEHFSDDEVWDIFVQVLLGLAHMHSKGIVHRDVKSLNLLLTDTGVVKLGDFGVSRMMSDRTLYLNSFYGTPLYLSPEIVEGKPYSQTTDVWSLGVVLYELLSLRPPFNGTCLQDVISAVVRGTVPPLPCSRPPELTDLVSKMLTREPESRPHAADLVQTLERQGRIRPEAHGINPCPSSEKPDDWPRPGGAPRAEVDPPRSTDSAAPPLPSEFRPPPRLRQQVGHVAGAATPSSPAGVPAGAARGRTSLWEKDPAPAVQVVRIRRRASSAAPPGRAKEHSPPRRPPQPPQPPPHAAAVSRKAAEESRFEEPKIGGGSSGDGVQEGGNIDAQPKSLREERWEERRRAHLQRIAGGGGEVVRIGGRASKAREINANDQACEERPPCAAAVAHTPARDRAEPVVPGRAAVRAASEGANFSPAVARVARGQSQPRRAPAARYDIIANRWVNG